jgi:hypothetical protein
MSRILSRALFWLGMAGLAWLLLSALLAPLRVNA